MADQQVKSVAISARVWALMRRYVLRESAVEERTITMREVAETAIENFLGGAGARRDKTRRPPPPKAGDA